MTNNLEKENPLVNERQVSGPSMDVTNTERVEAAYRATHTRLWRALVAFCGNEELASDAESEAFAQALRRGTAIKDPERWVWRASFHIARGLLAERSRLRVPAVSDPAEPASSAEFLSLLGSLSDQQRACVVLRYAGQLTPAEIADVLGTSSGTVRVQLHRAHANLRTAIKAERVREDLS